MDRAPLAGSRDLATCRNAADVLLVYRASAAGEMRGSDPSGRKLDESVRKMFKDFPTT